MPAPTAISPAYSAEELRAMQAHEPDRSYARRLLALALTAEGHSRRAVADCIGVGTATVREWVHRYNAGGPDALKPSTSSGRPPKLSAEQKHDLVRAMADADLYGLRLREIAKKINERFEVQYNEASVGRILRCLGFRFVSGRWRPLHRAHGVERRPQHPSGRERELEGVTD